MFKWMESMFERRKWRNLKIYMLFGCVLGVYRMLIVESIIKTHNHKLKKSNNHALKKSNTHESKKSNTHGHEFSDTHYGRFSWFSLLLFLIFQFQKRAKSRVFLGKHETKKPFALSK